MPPGVRLAHKSLDDLVAAGCTWDQAEELMRFPILKFLTASPEQLDAGMPVLKTKPNPNPNPNPNPDPNPDPNPSPNQVAHCHAMRVCHRDLKLENFVLDKSQSTLKLIDFGLSVSRPLGAKHEEIPRAYVQAGGTLEHLTLLLQP